MAGSAVWKPGKDYVLEENDLPGLKEVYALLSGSPRFLFTF
jgi:hypothetical protein